VAEGVDRTRLNRPSQADFLAEVLGELDELPEGLAERLAELLGEEDRAEAMRALFEEITAEEA